MVYESGDELAIPVDDVLTWTFDNDEVGDDHPVCRSHATRLGNSDLLIPSEIWIDPYTETTLNKGQARRLVTQLIAGLRRQGIQHGDTVGLHSFNSIYYPIFYLAIIGSGARFVGSNPAHKAREIKQLLQASHCQVVFVQLSELEKVLAAALDAGISKENVFIFDCFDSQPINGFASWKSLLSEDEEDWRRFTDSDESKRTPAVLLSTSGTTGPPKLAVMSHYAIVTQAAMADWVAGDDSSDVRRLISLPMFHSFVLPYHLLALRRGDTTFVMPRFDADDFARFINQFRITSIPLVPPIALRVFDSRVQRPISSSLKDVICAGAPMNVTTQARISRRLPSGTRFRQLWGLSELGWVTAFRNADNDHSGSVGRLLPNIQAKIADDSGNEVEGPHKMGEIYVKHPGVMTGYLHNAEADASSFAQGWFRTGDIGYCKDGKWCIVDRAKEMIKVRAWQVSPAELEACVANHASVRDVAVVGIASDSDAGERPIAFVQAAGLREHQDQLAGDIMALVRRDLASYKALAAVVFVDAIPRTASGKILRRLLRERQLSQKEVSA